MNKRKIDIKYVKSHDYKASLSTGVYGGITVNGLININFFVDRVIIPSHQEFEVDENGTVLNQISEKKDGDSLREVQYGALLDLNTAKLVVDWLGKKIKEHETLLK